MEGSGGREGGMEKFSPVTTFQILAGNWDGAHEKKKATLTGQGKVSKREWQLELAATDGRP